MLGASTDGRDLVLAPGYRELRQAPLLQPEPTREDSIGGQQEPGPPESGSLSKKAPCVAQAPARNFLGTP